MPIRGHRAQAMSQAMIFDRELAAEIYESMLKQEASFVIPAENPHDGRTKAVTFIRDQNLSTVDAYLTAVNIMDRFMVQKESLTESEYMLLAATCTNLASKISDGSEYDIESMSIALDRPRDDFIRAEVLVCDSIRYTLAVPHAMHFVRYVSHFAYESEKVIDLAAELLRAASKQPNFNCFLASIQGYSALLRAKQMLCGTPWGAIHRLASGKTADVLSACLRCIDTALTQHPSNDAGPILKSLLFPELADVPNGINSPQASRSSSQPSSETSYNSFGSQVS